MRHIARHCPLPACPAACRRRVRRRGRALQAGEIANGYVRMDTQTGEMSICEEKSGQLVCKMAADERTAFQDEIDRLQTELKV